jgi:carbon storage regulator
MLVVSRKIGEGLVIGGTITLTLVSCEGGRARIGITAPRDVPVVRGELIERPDGAGAAPDAPVAPR